MRVAGAFAALALLPSAAAHAQQITADRPGVGSGANVVPPFTLQGELGTDSKEVRLGLFDRFEIDRDDTSWSGKLALDDDKRLKVALKLSYDKDLHTVVEVPANYMFSDRFNLGTTVIWSHSTQTYAAGFNFTPTNRLTVSPTLYYESRTRTAIFAAWILPGHDNWQIDIGYDRHRVSAGISTALDLTHLLRRGR